MSGMSGWPRPVSPAASSEWQDWWRARDVRDPVMAAASEQGFVLSSAQLGGLGVSRSTARTRVRNGTWSAPAVGVVAPVDVGHAAPAPLVERRRHALLTSAGVLRNPSLVASGRSAAILAGLPTLRLPQGPELLSATTGGVGRHGGHQRYRAALTDAEVTTWFGVGVTRVARTVCDVARHDRRDGIMAADAALREGLVTRAELEAAVTAAAGWPGVTQAREVIALADSSAESPLESLTRLKVHDVGLPTPLLQYEIDGLWVDFCWPDRRFVLEADGMSKYSGDALQREKRRERRLQRLGFRVERVTWEDILRLWPQTVRWLAAALGL